MARPCVLFVPEIDFLQRSTNAHSTARARGYRSRAQASRALELLLREAHRTLGRRSGRFAITRAEVARYTFAEYSCDCCSCGSLDPDQCTCTALLSVA